MLTSGRVTFVSASSAMIVVSHDDGHAVVELTGDEGEFEVGDIVRADWDALGSESLRKAGSTRSFDVYMQGNSASFCHAVEIARLSGG